MRDAYHEELDALTDKLVEMTRLVRSAISRATTALLDSDLQLAESVITRDEEVNSVFADIETTIFELMARQQPVAVDLRMVITALRMGTDLERMGDLAVHVAKVARLRHPDSAIPPELRSTILEMGQIAENLVTKAGSCVASRDVDSAMELEQDDDAMDRLHRKLFRSILAKDWQHGVEPAIDITLVGRYYERYADHAVRVAQDVVYLVTGTRPS
ncbi:Phosphate transport system regulatory protein PhoU [[Actinomadura] parvosata subsp. kistnae]|uniref:Phosphate-specific transport system accessory protein PhoU n=2 Tax=Nonomuraea TaxID=83681 RepID=A0A1V0A9Y2_9ACTN|nr:MULTISPECIES: phosphate signaling complex protein PhoU [unclassified Nonomuraea]AQZ67016.1 phosphate transport system regulatory protein PhoU [Nonomuraea sp. ATCC 55076]NJP92011.1 phosphate signaling complex protein PhoU [Nonomuraea sp. FMUSA5-5]SPL94810.1 Phosphate transport system regulatory protein PhoU [Actinomadura parvosata subsp. kistnae]